MLAVSKVLLGALAVVALLLFSTGLVALKKDGYACAGGWEVGFEERQELFHYGALHIYGYPFTRECPEQRRYDPNDVQSCVDTGFCTISDSDALTTQ